MARHASALKAARQAVKRNERNRQARATVKTALKKLRTAITAKEGNKKETLPKMLSEVQRVLMKAASKNLIKRENASRQIARLSTAIHKAISA